MNKELIERYLYAVTRKLPKKIREDVSRELESLIMDMLEERCGEMLPTDKDVRVVLTELGTPTELAEKYDPDPNNSLIGAPYYTLYKYILKIVLICTVFGMAVAGFMVFLTGGIENWYLATLQWIGMIASGTFTAFGFVTLLFAFFQRKGVKIEVTGLDDLPAVPGKKQTLSRGESVFGILFSICFMTVFLFAPQIFCAVITENGSTVPIFDLQVLHQTWFFILGMGMLGIIGEIVKLIEGQYTIRVLIATVVTNLLTMLLVLVWLVRYQIFNPAFSAFMVELFEPDTGAARFTQNVFGQFDLFFLGVFLFALILDTIMTAIHTLNKD